MKIRESKSKGSVTLSTEVDGKEFKAYYTETADDEEATARDRAKAERDLQWYVKKGAS